MWSGVWNLQSVSCCLAEALSFLPSAGKSFLLGRVDEAVSNELGLGELAGLTVANEADSPAYEVSPPSLPPPLAACVTAASVLRSTRT